jgi:hypothetical protein
LSALQEQHSDLLGLLAQQEIELSVFRAALEAKLGTEVVLNVCREAQKNVVDMYGSYTNFRQFPLDDSGFGETI